MKMCLISHQKVFGRSGFLSNIPWKRRQNCKLTSLFLPLKECTAWNLCGWRFRSLSRIRRTLLTDMPQRLSVLDCRSPRITAEGRRHSGNALGCTNWRRKTRWIFIRDRTFFTPLPCPSTDMLLEMGFHVELFHGEICAESLQGIPSE